MVRILLACNLGMSTSLLVTRMEKAAESKGIEVEIKAIPASKVEEEINQWDIILLGPQVRYYQKELEQKSQGKTPIMVINMKDYGMMDGPKVLDAALEKLGY